MTRKQQMIVDTAETLFLKHGIKRITIREICQEAGVSKVTYYRYFSNKDDLVKLIRDRLISEGFSRFDEISRLETSFADKVDLITEWRRDFFSGMSTDFIEEVLSMKDLNEMIKERFFSMITSAQDKGDIRRELSPELVWLVTEKLYELITDGSWKNITPDYSEYQAQMRTLFFHGLLTNNPE